MTHIILPFVVFPIINVLHTIPRELEEAARDLGANRLTTARKVVLPLALPGIMAGLLMGFLLTMASYVTPSILGGKITVLPTMIVSQVTGSNNWPFAGALSMILLVVAILVIVGYHRARLQLRGTQRD
jgi:ABC-type spermidine/putrescine transport system permease subunit I